MVLETGRIGSMKSGQMDAQSSLQSSSVAFQDAWRCPSQCSTQEEGMSLPLSPVSVTAKGWPLVEVLVAQQIPLSEVAVRLRLSRLMRCKSPNLRLACAARRSPPRSKASCVGQAGSARALSQAHKAASGRGRASSRSLNSRSTLKAAIREPRQGFECLIGG